MKTLKYGGVPEAEAEVIIRLDKQDRVAHVNSTWPEWSRKFERLHGAPKKATERNGVIQSAFWTLPLAAISIRRGAKRTAGRPKTAPGIRPGASASPLSGKIPATLPIGQGPAS